MLAFYSAYARLFQHLQLYIDIKDRASLSGLANDSTLQVLIVLPMLCFGFFAFLARSVPRQENSQRSRIALQALQSVLVPTCSLWPAKYIQLVKRVSIDPDFAPGSRIIIPLSMLLQDISDGVIEIRNPVFVFEYLIDGGVCSCGCCVSVSVDWHWWVEWLDRVVRGFSDLSPARWLNDFRHPDDLAARRDLRWVHALLTLKTRLRYMHIFSSLAVQEPVKRYGAVCLSYFSDTLAGTRLIRPLARAFSDPGSTINLDHQPLSHLATLRPPQGSSTTVEFTSLSSHISLLSTKHILCMIPFLARRLPHGVLDVLATVDDTRNFRLSALTNTSAAHGEALAAASTMLANDPVERKQCIEDVGIRGWRERRLMIDLEGALVRMGWLEHWNAVLEAC